MNLTIRLVASAVLLLILGYRLYAPSNGPVLTLLERDFSFGAIGDTIEVSHVFKLTNTGDAPLTIVDVHATCGCTATMLDKKEIAPGDTANLKVTLNPKGKGEGPIDKLIYISSNSASGQSDSLSISAKITSVHADKMMTVKNIFTGDCRKCHVDKGAGKFAVDLFNADCLMCHSTSPKAHGPHMGKMIAMNLPDDSLYHKIANGKPGSNMPAFAQAHGGPLTEEQIKSLVRLINPEGKVTP